MNDDGDEILLAGLVHLAHVQITNAGVAILTGPNLADARICCGRALSLLGRAEHLAEVMKAKPTVAPAGE
jgi:hypothetical protein